MVGTRTGALLAAALTLFASIAASQDKVTLVPRRLLLDVVPASGSGFTAADALLVARSLDEKIQETDPTLVVIESTGEAAGTSDEAMRSRSEAAGADCWATASLEGDWTSARLKVHAVDLLAGSTVADVSISRAGWGSAAGLSLETWSDVVPGIAGKFPMRERAGSGSDSVVLARLTIHAMPGTVITGLGKAPLRLDSDGTGSRELPPNREYAFRAVRPGYVPLEERVYLSEDRTVTLKQEKSAGRALELSLTDGRAPGVDFTLQIPDPSLFVRVGLTTYALGLDLSQSQVFVSYPLTVAALQAGTYLSPEDRPFRFYVGLAGFIRLVHISGLPEDSLSPGGARFVGGVELPRSTHGRFYFEYTPTLYYTLVPDAFHAALGTSDTPGWLFGSNYAVTLFSVRMGFRWAL